MSRGEKPDTSQNWDQIVDAVVAIASAQTWGETKRIVEERRDLLLTDAAEEMLTFLLAKYQGDMSTTRVLEELGALLARCRQQSIDAAFTRYLQPSAATPENELSKPRTPLWGPGRLITSMPRGLQGSAG